MDFENQFTRPMIHAMGTRMAILKMESVCDKPDAKFQQGFALGFEEAFNFIREFGHSKQVLLRLDVKEKMKKAADLAKKTGIAQVTAVQDMNIEPMPVNDEKIKDIPGIAGPTKENNTTMCNLNDVKKRIDDSDLESFKKAIRNQHPDWPEHLVSDVAAMDRETLLECIEVSKKRDEFPKAIVEAPANQKFNIAKLTKGWFKDNHSIDIVICAKLKDIGFDTYDFVEYMEYMFRNFGCRKDYESDDLKSINDIGDLLIYVNDHVAEPK